MQSHILEAVTPGHPAVTVLQFYGRKTEKTEPFAVDGGLNQMVLPIR